MRDLIFRGLENGRRALCVSALAVALSACTDGSGKPSGNDRSDGGTDGAPPTCAYGLDWVFDGGLQGVPEGAGPLRVNEVMSSNDGAWVDEEGETNDFIELVNTGTGVISLADYSIADEPGRAVPLPDIPVEPGETVLLWADDTPSQGPLHLPFKLSRTGTEVLLWTGACTLADHVTVPELPTSESYARLPDGSGSFTVCRYATPERTNGESCVPPPPPSIDDTITFAEYPWPAAWPTATGPLVITELALRPAAFVELVNTGSVAVALADHALRIAPHEPGVPWPTSADGAIIAWPAGVTSLAPGARLTVPVTDADLTAVAARPAFEGVVTVFRGTDAEPSDRVDFMRWPDGAALSRSGDTTGTLRYCASATPDAPSTDCTVTPSREAGDRTRSLATPGDFEALAEGGTELGEQSVKFVVDMEAGDVVHLLGTREWALHYAWVRENVEHLPHLDRCDPEQAGEFRTGWTLWSQAEYYRVEGRRYLLGTLIRHLNGLHTVEFTPGDVISGEQMRRAFFAVTARTENPRDWHIRPTEGRQVAVMRTVEGSVPMVGPNAPYKDVTYQPLTAAVGYGTLRFVPASELEAAELGPNVIVVTDDVPNGSVFMGGLITEAFQTPLAHVNVLSRARNTPNMALRGARTDPRITALMGQLVRLEVRTADFDLRVATPEEADAFWQSRKPTGPKLQPARDLSVRGIVPLQDRGVVDLPVVGSKAAGMAELYRVSTYSIYCPATTLPLLVPPKAFAVPVAHYAEHFAASGAEALLAELEQDPAFRADPTAHASGLSRVRELMLRHPVEPEIRAALVAAVEERYGSTPLRFRSSSNTEDLATFTGAGLHTSTSTHLDDDGDGQPLEDALRVVWASLWNTRAYDERDFANVEQSLAAMGVLVHEAGRSEAAQGVAISRNALHATRSDQYYINAQIGEAAVTNPAPGVTSDELVYTPPPRSPRIEYVSRSSLSRGQDVLTLPEIQRLGCALDAIHRHFRPLVDPASENRLFAVQIEYKLVKPNRDLLVKQARPYTFGTLDVPQDCREF